jgi:hypothetical protein
VKCAYDGDDVKCPYDGDDVKCPYDGDDLFIFCGYTNFVRTIETIVESVFPP